MCLRSGYDARFDASCEGYGQQSLVKESERDSEVVFWPVHVRLKSSAVDFRGHLRMNLKALDLIGFDGDLGVYWCDV